MEDLSRLCMSCMRKKDENNFCPHCKTDTPPEQAAPLLPLQAILNERYCIGKAIKKNGEGITYVAYDLNANRPATVREFFPDSIAQRDFDGVTVIPNSGSENVFNDCLSDFNELWSKLIRLKGLSAMINAYDIFFANGTSYAVYSDSESLNLRDYLLQTPTGYIPWEQARILFMPVLSTLGTLHTSGIIHKGISPSSFIFSLDGKLKLTDFSIGTVRSAYGDLEPEIAEGFAPLELYNEAFSVGAWTDVYAFTAVLYRALIGTMPISAPVRAQNDQMMIPAKFAEQMPPYVINALINGMQIEPDDRTRNIEQLRSNLSASPRAVSASAPVYTPPKKTPAQPKEQPTQYIQTPPTREQRAPSSIYTEKQEINHDAIRKMEEQKKKNKTLTVFLSIILVLLIAGIGLIVSAISTMSHTSSQNETTTATQTTVIKTVPNFVGQTYQAIVSDEIYASNFHIVKVEQASSTVEAGYIISQSIAAGTSVEQGTDIILYVSTGPKTFAVPDVTGYSYEEAIQILAAEGLLCSKATKYNDGTNTPDTVAETFPTAGTLVTAGDSISVILWSNPNLTQTDETNQNADNAVVETTLTTDTNIIQP